MKTRKEYVAGKAPDGSQIVIHKKTGEIIGKKVLTMYTITYTRKGEELSGVRFRWHCTTLDRMLWAYNILKRPGYSIIVSKTKICS